MKSGIPACLPPVLPHAPPICVLCARPCAERGDAEMDQNHTLLLGGSGRGGRRQTQQHVSELMGPECQDGEAGCRTEGRATLRPGEASLGNAQEEDAGCREAPVGPRVVPGSRSVRLTHRALTLAPTGGSPLRKLK